MITSVTRLHKKEYVTKWFSYIHTENLIHAYRHFNYSVSITGPIIKKFRAHLWPQVHKSKQELQEYRCAIMIRQRYNITSHCWPFDLSVCMLSLVESLHETNYHHLYRGIRKLHYQHEPLYEMSSRCVLSVTSNS